MGTDGILGPPPTPVPMTPELERRLHALVLSTMGAPMFLTPNEDRLDPHDEPWTVNIVCDGISLPSLSLRFDVLTRRFVREFTAAERVTVAISPYYSPEPPKRTLWARIRGLLRSEDRPHE